MKHFVGIIYMLLKFSFILHKYCIDCQVYIPHIYKKKIISFSRLGKNFWGEQMELELFKGLLAL